MNNVFFLKNLIKNKYKNNKNASKQDSNAATLKKVHNTMTAIKKTKNAVFFILKKIHNAEMGTANTDMAVMPLS